MDRLKGLPNIGRTTAEMGIRSLSLGVPGFGFSLSYSVKFENLFEIKTMLFMQETLLEMAQ